MKCIGRKRAAAAVLAVAVGILLGAAGCASQPWRNEDGSVRTGKIDYQKEPTTGRVYHLYVPSSYNPRRQYPLVITAQGTFPFDQAAGQRDRWIGVAERYNIIVCSADFDSATGWLGYDYVVNFAVPSDTETIVHAWRDGAWEQLGTAEYRVDGNRIEIAFARDLVGAIAKPPAFDFHWADNIETFTNVSELGVNGDSAPNRRWNYRYATR